jgi:acetyl esterase/lipase
MRPLLVLALAATVLGSSTLRAADPIPLYPDKAPGALGTEPKDIPTLTVFLPAGGEGTGAAMVICPGGGYGGLAPHEGAGYAEWLAKNGVAGFVLKYRLGSGGYHHPAMLNDAARAIRLVRSRAAEWKLDPQRIGVMGSSAGGHLASTILTHFDAGQPDAADPIDRLSSRPDLGVLCYPVITMGEFTHGGSKKNLLGENPSPELIDLLSNEKQVIKETPPTFIFHTYADAGVPVENALLFAEALRKNHVPFDLHIYEKGGHGMGLGPQRDKGVYHPWAADCLYFLKEHGFVKNEAPK